MEMRPWVGRKPATPVIAAGMRTEPPVSVPSEPWHMPAATLAPEPPLVPPGICSGFQGLRHCPNTGFVVTTPNANSCILALPISTAPAARRRRTTSASSFGTWSAKNRAPLVVRMPAVAILSFKVIVMPCNRPSQRPSAAARSASAARVSAASSSQVTTAFSVPLWRRIFSMQASVAATAEGAMRVFSF